MEKIVKKREKFYRYLKANNWNIRSLARAMDCPHDRIYKWLYRKATPSPSAMLLLVKVLNVSERKILEMFAD